MAGCGIKNYVFWRPNEEHKSLPSPVFNWIGDNNTSIKTYRIGGVGGEIFTADIMKDTLTPLIENIDNTQNDLMVVYGVTDHGGAPTREMIDKIKLAQNDNKLIENDNYKINYNENGIVNLTDKKSGKSIIDKLLIPYAVGDICDTWGFNKMVYEDEKEFMTLSDIKITENGKVRITLRLVWDYNKSTVEQKISLYEDMVDCSYRVVWNEEGKALKFMANISSDIKECVASNPYGEVIREKSEYEKPISEYIILKGDENKVTYSFDSIFAYNYDGDNINLTILRNCIYGDLRTEDLDPKRDYLYMGKGLVTGKIRITFNDNSSNNATVLNNPNEIKTLKVINSKMIECNMLEEEI